MMFLQPEAALRDQPVLAISQPMHAWISGQLLRAWADDLDLALLLAAEQHDIAWLDWEAAPSFDAARGRPHLFRDVGAAVHAPMWARGVDRASAAWGSRVALLISRHGGVIYTRFTDRHRLSTADADAASHYLRRQAPLEAAWSRELGLSDARLAYESSLIAFVDTVSLALCGELATPLDLTVQNATGSRQGFRLRTGGQIYEFALAPWPFREPELIVTGEARPLPAGGCADEAAMQAWLAAPARTPLRIRLTPGPLASGRQR